MPWSGKLRAMRVGMGRAHWTYLLVVTADALAAPTGHAPGGVVVVASAGHRAGGTATSAVLHAGQTTL